MSRLVFGLALILASIRAPYGAQPGATVVSIEARDQNQRLTGGVIFFLIHEDGAYRAGVTILRPGRSPAGFELRIAPPGAREWAGYAARMRRLGQSATIEPCAGIRSLLPRL